MRHLRIILPVLLLFPVLYGCNKELKVNANWRDITVVYGLLNQAQDTTYIKITKAFLGEGDALMFAKVPDSSTYPDKLEVRLESWSGNTFIKSYNFDTITIHTKQAGDSIFYYPDQLVYYNITGPLDEANTYWLKIRHKKTGVVDSAVTTLVHNFVIESPDPVFKQVDFIPGGTTFVSFHQAYGGKRYQLLIHIRYRETIAGVHTDKTIDWMIFKNFQVADSKNVPNLPIQKSIDGDDFYATLKANIPINQNVSSRQILWLDYTFSVGSDDLSTYMEASEPSLSIIQERPSFSNIFNGIGLFSSRYLNEIDTIRLGDQTNGYIHSDPGLISRGF